jgi:hypothetical protein
VTSGSCFSSQIGKSAPIVKYGDLAGGVIGAQETEVVRNLPSSPRQTGWKFNHAAQPAICQLGLLRVGTTARASRVQAERAINSRRRGMRAVETPSTLKPSTPMMMTRGPCHPPAG